MLFRRQLQSLRNRLAATSTLSTSLPNSFSKSSTLSSQLFSNFGNNSENSTNNNSNNNNNNNIENNANSVNSMHNNENRDSYNSYSNLPRQSSATLDEFKKEAEVRRKANVAKMLGLLQAIDPSIDASRGSELMNTFLA